MKKSELKQLIKPLVKECIHEVLLEEGLLSNVVAEVAKGLQQNIIVETQQINEQTQLREQTNNSRSKLKEHKDNLMKTIGKDAYNGVNLFEGTEPESQNTPSQGHSDLGNPRDSGVDISSLLGKSSAIWQAIK
jgi:Txe/YoeB family toxin of Txe-Axe toxin-antitoxin module